MAAGSHTMWDLIRHMRVREGGTGWGVTGRGSWGEEEEEESGGPRRQEEAEGDDDGGEEGPTNKMARRFTSDENGALVDEVVARWDVLFGSRSHRISAARHQQHWQQHWLRAKLVTRRAKAQKTGGRHVSPLRLKPYKCRLLDILGKEGCEGRPEWRTIGGPPQEEERRLGDQPAAQPGLIDTMVAAVQPMRQELWMRWWMAQIYTEIQETRMTIHRGFQDLVAAMAAQPHQPGGSAEGKGPPAVPPPPPEAPQHQRERGHGRGHGPVRGDKQP
ncbi:hypothetical protein XELAEV_18043696mg [Xenopus laevis]|uniref:Uncharacterized protein n=1 Tax=Xenopus laevis TaxID=8355 RepID=A0A974H334_XENLA|nr:hypothetical protein XELAEV_18043696mg [Xenopus laevis]